MTEHTKSAANRDEHPPPVVERRCDVAIIGGSAAGLAAALQLGRQRRSVIVIDAGEPRNAPAADMHSYLGYEGVAPAAFTEVGREEVRSYGVEVLAGRADDVVRDGDRFRVELVGGTVVIARQVLVATGLVDLLPDIDGLREHWGRGVIHCPFCHGYEARDERIVAIITNEIGLHPAVFFRQLTDRFTLVLHADVESDHPQVVALKRAGVDVIDGRVERVEADATGRLTGLVVGGVGTVEADVAVVASRFEVRVDAVASLGVAMVPHATGLGDVVEVDPMGATSVPGVWAAGNVVDPNQQVLQAASNGSFVGAMVAAALARADVEAAARPSARQDDWDRRYEGDRIWSGNPNGALVAEVGDLAPQRALDVGAGEGGDAVWLAERGWEVTAADISARALDVIDRVAGERELDITGARVDANDRAPFETDRFDLVTAHYASLHRTPDARGIENLLAAVAPGGTLLFVGHDPAPMQAPIDTSQHSRPFDPAAYVGVDDVAAALDGRANWSIEVHETRERPGGAASSHHVDDVVLRARRTA